ncbi:hypothetical protein BCV70DRAFT_191861 [Testicularia cyperi]|uniref:Uncharacterized protein n=1 Tax=Testicularia cyperi TaxID=1882483 RepID=A0A317XKZ2_9BASI|nr:hypothetical protein BCV70DRAFT_191861 [Testicularia cyperi]
MTKSDADVIKEFHELVNMTADELEKWLKSKDSTSSGWTNGEGGETVGHNSGTKIVDILRRNPDKKDDKYTDEDLKHMRKVVSYNKRHLAQEQHLKEKKSKEELQQTKSYKSLKSEYHTRVAASLPYPFLESPFHDGTSNAPSSTFRSDVALPTALNMGRIGVNQTMAATAAASAASTQSRLSSKEHLDQLEENVNKTIDAEVDTLLESYKELISLASIADKDKFRVAQEAFQAEARADIMVRSAQSLSLLSDSLKLSLLMSKSPDPSLDQEALELIKSTEMEKIKCAQLLQNLLGVRPDQAWGFVDRFDASQTAGLDRGSTVPLEQDASQPRPKDETSTSASASATATAAQQVKTASTSSPQQHDDSDLDMEDVSAG